MVRGWQQRNLPKQKNSLWLTQKKELFILDGLLEKANILEKICSEKTMNIPKQQRSKTEKEARRPPKLKAHNRR